MAIDVSGQDMLPEEGFVTKNSHPLMRLAAPVSWQTLIGLVVKDWHAPDHTKIEEFRNRLSTETHRQLANMIAQASVSLGFADPSEVDFDSTVQEANLGKVE